MLRSPRRDRISGLRLGRPARRLRILSYHSALVWFAGTKTMLFCCASVDIPGRDPVFLFADVDLGRRPVPSKGTTLCAYGLLLTGLIIIKSSLGIAYMLARVVLLTNKGGINLAACRLRDPKYTKTASLQSQVRRWSGQEKGKEK
jgi:hypothetical protein